MPTAKGYSLKEVATKVGRSPATIVRWMDKRKVDVRPKKNAQGHYFFTESDLRKFVDFNESVQFVA